MRLEYRGKTPRRYWEDRWAAVPADPPMRNIHEYPLRFSELVLSEGDDLILEAGCGAGRILRFYNDRGFPILGMDFIQTPLARLKSADPTLDVVQSDIRHLPFRAESFSSILAFGLYHSLDKGLSSALAETRRVLKPRGRLCASFRADNIQNHLSDWLVRRRHAAAAGPDPVRHVHKLNLKRCEIRTLLENAGLKVEAIHPATNMPFFFRFPVFRRTRTFCESDSRANGYALNAAGKLLNTLVTGLLRDQFSSVFVILARKADPPCEPSSSG